MSDDRPLIFDRPLVARRRAARADHLEGYDFLLRRVADDLLERLAFVARAFPVALSLGPGGGGLVEGLMQRRGGELLVEMDAAAGLLSGVADGGVVGDEEALPFAAGGLDLVVSSLSLQLVNDLPGALVQVRRALRPDGLFLGAMLGGGTLGELRLALATAEAELEGGASPRVAPFADVRDLGALLQRAGFALPVADSDTVEVGYQSALHLMADLRGMGWANMLLARRRALLRRATLERALACYAERFTRPDGKVRATFEIITLTGWAPHESQQKPLRPGSAKARLADALGVKERGAGDTEATGGSCRGEGGGDSDAG